MAWTVLEHPDFVREREDLNDEVSDKLDEVMLALEEVGPNLGRPLVDTLNGSKHKKMKEIRFNASGVWRFAFAFDEDRQAVVLCGGNKEGKAQRKFYKKLIATADERFDEWLEAEKE
ncbi:addiction module toxin RelE [Mesorhizobium sp. B2-9-1]|uniref:type II toxin-antitoxin system RelE/ParE family toxin n=1 Tax=unclassified Mesorhizobium TaxID=325217 RepID=UPI0011273F3C|nr:MULTISPECIES: type II toxin-antitoxin system RelE/ParE family toxin [unclassified Mesorhizobium]TPI46675.1 addiction module toxin RelE [Mesorhizobium sp. B2-9-1]TPJ28807.1 addiction module toxin RelE [Mesorhizobium sp. B2-7-2]TPO02338.1 addiction module toxin RelE [Mesorhizobium sp. B1-1-5]